MASMKKSVVDRAGRTLDDKLKGSGLEQTSKLIKTLANKQATDYELAEAAVRTVEEWFSDQPASPRKSGRKP